MLTGIRHRLILGQPGFDESNQIAHGRIFPRISRARSSVIGSSFR
jgi:hypothetical protein